MEESTGLLRINCSCSEALLRLRGALETAGLTAVGTFDLQAARSSGTQCTCPRHGTVSCDCQMVVLLIYGRGTAPTVLVLHGSDGRTWISLPGGPDQAIEALIGSTVAGSASGRRASEGL